MYPNYHFQGNPQQVNPYPLNDNDYRHPAFGAIGPLGAGLLGLGLGYLGGEILDHPGYGPAFGPGYGPGFAPGFGGYGYPGGVPGGYGYPGPGFGGHGYPGPGVGFGPTPYR